MFSSYVVAERHATKPGIAIDQDRDLESAHSCYICLPISAHRL